MISFTYFYTAGSGGLEGALVDDIAKSKKGPNPQPHGIVSSQNVPDDKINNQVAKGTEENIRAGDESVILPGEPKNKKGDGSFKPDQGGCSRKRMLQRGAASCAYRPAAKVVVPKKSEVKPAAQASTAAVKTNAAASNPKLPTAQQQPQAGKATQNKAPQNKAPQGNVSQNKAASKKEPPKQGLPKRNKQPAKNVPASRKKETPKKVNALQGKPTLPSPSQQASKGNPSTVKKGGKRSIQYMLRV